MRPTSFVIFGPTASGKTDFSSELARFLPVDIINADAAQIYEPLTIGTAKTDWKNQSVEHHLFDIFNEPVDYSAHQYRAACAQLTNALSAKDRIPVFVGGSGFYLKSLFFPLGQPGDNKEEKILRESSQSLERAAVQTPWELLFSVDPVRAREIHPNDPYKINRALDIWRETGVLPSQLKPEFEPLVKDTIVVFLDRDRSDIAQRVVVRINDMIKNGWIEEVRGLSREWRAFLERRKFIGYCELFDVCDGKLKEKDAVERIALKTLHYAKRQRTFWRSLKKSFASYGVRVVELNLSQAPTVDCVRLLLQENGSF